ncbi:hypothetical protein J7X11_002281 [Vibrio parahaemolyticus]|nr:hypothetical protein [Vibrio parahaemolyticus]
MTNQTDHLDNLSNSISRLSSQIEGIAILVSQHEELSRHESNAIWAIAELAEQITKTTEELQQLEVVSK